MILQVSLVLDSVQISNLIIYLLVKTEKAIAAVLWAKTPEKKQKALDKIEFKARRAAREVRDFLPELSYTSKEIAVIVHLTSSKNFICRYHQKNRGHCFCDSIIEFTGVGYPKVLSSVQRGRVIPPPGHMHCGCSFEDVLFDFFIWKTLDTFSTHPRLADKRYHMNDNEVLAPKTRRFWLEHWKAVTCLTINDIYGGDAGHSGWIPRLAALSLVRQVEAFTSLGVSVSINWPTEEAAEEFAAMLRKGQALRPGVPLIGVQAGTSEQGVASHWKIVEVKLPAMLSN